MLTLTAINVHFRVRQVITFLLTIEAEGGIAMGSARCELRLVVATTPNKTTQPYLKLEVLH